MRQTLNQRRRVETTLQNLPFYCLIHGKHGKGMTFAVYRVLSDLKGTPRLMRIGELGHTIYNQKVVQTVRSKLQGCIIDGQPTWDALCAMTDHELQQLIHTTDTAITMTVISAKEVL